MSLIASRNAALALVIACACGAPNPQQPAASRTDPPLFQDWTQPKVVIVFSGQQHGRTEPCGCSPEFQKGGLARLGGAIDFVRSKQWPTVVVHLGGLLEDSAEQMPPGQLRIGTKQTEIKFNIMIECLKRMGVSDFNVSPEDLSIPQGFDGMTGWLLTDPSAKLPPGLSSNLTIPKNIVALGAFNHVVIREAGPQKNAPKIGITGVVGKTFKGRIEDPSLTWQDPVKVLPDALKLMKEKKADVRVLLLYDYLDEAKAIAKELIERKAGEFDVIIYCDKADEPKGQVEKVGNTTLVTVGTKGKYGGAVGIFDKGRTRSTRFELLHLDERFPESKSVLEVTRGKYLEQLGQANLVADTLQSPFDPANPTLGYVGSDTCKVCHPKAFEKWATTEHSHAMKSLVEGRLKGRDIGLGAGSHVNPECVNCHSTGFQKKTGYDGTELTKHLANNGCENCHRAGSEHAKTFSDKKILAAPDTDENKAAIKRAKSMVHLDSQVAENNFCVRCHDAENDPAFNFNNAWNQIDHTDEAGKDEKLWNSIREKLLQK